MTLRSRRSRSLGSFAVAAVLALAVGFGGVTTASPAFAAPAEEPVSPAIARIVTVDTTLRAEPSHDAVAVASLTAGAQVSVSAQVPAWRKVTVDGAQGWIPYSVTAEVPRDFGKRVPRELGTDITLRAQPGEKAAAGASVLAHTYASAVAAAGSWRKISTANGAGWVPASALEEVTIRRPASSATVALNVRASASGSTEVVLTLRKGQTVQVLGTRGAWTSVRTGASDTPATTQSGWTATKYLVDSDIRVAKTAVNLRAQPWTGKVRAVIPKGAEVRLTGGSWVDYARTPARWLSVVYGSLRGYVAADYLARPY